MSGLNNRSLDNMDIGELIKPYLKHWKWFLLSLFVAVILGLVYIRYSVPQYEIKAKIQILEDDSSNSELGAFRDLDILGGDGSVIEDEMEILKSRTQLIELVRELGLNIKIIALGKIKNSEVYNNKPFKINFSAPDSILHVANQSFFITLSSETSFEYSLTEEDLPKVGSYGKIIPSPVGDITITPNITNLEAYKGRRYQVSVIPLSMASELLGRRIQVTVGNENSKILSIVLNDPIINKGRDILNTIVNNYNQNDVEDKKAVADRTSNFIEDRIAGIYSNLSSVDQSAVEFKSARGLADIASQTNLNLNLGAANQQELQNASVQLDIATSMKDIVDNQEGYEVLPSNIGLSDPSIVTTTARYNQLASDRKRLLESSNEKNPIIKNLDQQLDDLKSSMQSSLNSVTNNLGLQVNSLSSQLSKINSRIYSAPKNESALREITRKQQTTESLYLYLLQKREEAQISFASATPKSKIIDGAYLVNRFPVAPKKPIILMACILLGFILPFSAIYVKQLFDNKIQNKVGLEKMVGDIPVLAELPKLTKKENTLVQSTERTVLAESLRILRTNLDYIIKSKTSNSKNNVIYITSSVPGEGKTLVSSNLAMIYATTGKKVLLIGADIRNPKIYQFYSGKNVNELGKPARKKENLGLTEYLVDDHIAIDDIVHPMLAHDQEIDIIYSGKIPPNPTELLMNQRMKTLLDSVKESYDYVIVDTAPIMVVTDTILISEFADQIVYVTRAGVTENKVIEFPLKLHKEGKLKGLSFIVNGVAESNLGYGGKYGYGYGETTKKWWKF